MSTEENKAVIRRLFEEFYRKRNTDVLDEIVAPDYVRRFAKAGWVADEARGPEVYRLELRFLDSTFPDWTFVNEQMIAEGDKVAVVSLFTGTNEGDAFGPFGGAKATGRRMIMPVIVVSRIADGRIAEDWEADNEGSIWQQLGLVPSAGK